MLARVSGARRPRVVPGPRRLPVVLVAMLAVAIAVPAEVFAGLGRPVSPAPAIRASGAEFTFDLSGRGDFVAQDNFVQCVGASMQMMLNMIRPDDDRTAATQVQLQRLARSLSGQRPGGQTRKGASVIGWTAGLNNLGAGPYRTVGEADLGATLRLAARAMRQTNRPVGLLVWRGRHAWVMAGFTATADPLVTDEFEVTSVIVLDPLSPYGSKTWGPSPKPRQALTIAELGRQFVPRGSRSVLPGGGADTSATTPAGSQAGTTNAASAWSQALAGKYVIVMPYPDIHRWRSPRALP